jgi:hypothetical protein
VRQGPAHDYVTIWIRHQSVGTLCVGKGDGEELRALLLGGEACTLDPQQRAHVAELNRAGELTPCPQDLQPTEHTLEVAQALGFDEQRTQQEVRKFVGFYTDVRPEPRLDWQALLRGWLRRSAQRRPLTGVKPISPNDPRVRVQRRISGALAAEAREVEQRMVERAGNWNAPIALATVGPVELSGHDPPPGNWALFEGPREVIDSLLAQHGYPTAEAGPGAPAPPHEDASKAEVESRPLGVPSAAGAPPTTDDDAWRDEETIG